MTTRPIDVHLRPAGLPGTPSVPHSSHDDRRGPDRRNLADHGAGPTRPSARLTAVWITSNDVRVTVDGPVDADAVERLHRVLDLVARAGGRCVTVDLTRLRGRASGLLEVLAATWHRLTRDGGRLHLVGLSPSDPEVPAVSELFGHPRSPVQRHTV